MKNSAFFCSQNDQSCGPDGKAKQDHNSFIQKKMKTSLSGKYQAPGSDITQARTKQSWTIENVVRSLAEWTLEQSTTNLKQIGKSLSMTSNAK